MTSDTVIVNTATVATVASGATLSLTNLEAVPSMDLTKITDNGTLNADWSGTATFTGKLNNANLTVSSGTMTVASTATIANASSIVVDGVMIVDANKVTGKTLSGTGTLDVNNLDATLTADFTNLTTTTINADFSGTGTYTGNLTNVDALTVSSGTMTVTDNILGALATSGAGNIVVQVNTNSAQDFANLTLTGTETIQFTANSTFTGNFQNSHVSIDSGVTVNADGSKIDGKIVGGSGTLNITGTGDGNLEMLNISATTTATISDGATTLSNLGVNLDGSTSSSNLTVDMANNSVTSVKTGSGDDTINLAANDMTNSLTIDGGSATNGDTIALTSSATDLTSSDFTNITNIETVNFFSANDALTIGTGDTKLDNIQLNLGAGDDTYTTDINDLTSADNIDGGNGSNTLSMATSGTLADADFTNISNFTTLNLAGGADTVTLSTHANNTFTSGTTVLGNAGNDSFTIDFSNLSKFSLDGGANTDTVTTNGGTLYLPPSNVGLGLGASNIETLDISGLTLSGGDGNTIAGKALEIADTDIETWTTGAAGGTLQLDITSTQAANIELNDGGTVAALGNTATGSYTYTFTDNTVLNYTIA